MRPKRIPDELEPLPTDGLEVQEVRDEDTVRLFRRAWHERLIREARQAAIPAGDKVRTNPPVRAA